MDHLALLKDEVAAMAAALRAADPARPLPSCPGWTVADLTAHLTAVHRWARAALERPASPPYDEVPATPDDYAGAAEALVTRLGELPLDAPCWTFDPGNRTASFWRRRQLHEVSMHRWDVDPHDLDAVVAADGVTEVLEFFAPRQVRLGRIELPPGAVVLDGGTRTWTLGEGEPTATVTAPVADLNLLLWGRRTLAEVRIDGDAETAERLLTCGLTP